MIIPSNAILPANSNSPGTEGDTDRFQLATLYSRFEVKPII